MPVRQPSETTEDLPDYNAQLEAYHCAFTAELKAIIAELPIAAGGRVLDVACGDGFYTRLLASRVGAGGVVVGVDCLKNYLDVAGTRPEGDGAAAVAFVAGNIDHFPFTRGAFDLAWCAQSLYSLPDPVAALRAMGEAVKPGGLVAVLENDAMHDLILPWPAGLELKVRIAEYQANRAAGGGGEKYYVSRNLWEVCRCAGLEPVHLKTHAFDRHAPLDEAERTFLAQFLGRLAERVGRHLARGDRKALQAVCDSQSERGLLGCANLTLTILNTVLWGMRRR